jgi:hypothetical protein
LAVIAGLEDGCGKVLVRLIPDPLRNLHWQPTVDIVVSGVTRVATMAGDGTSNRVRRLVGWVTARCSDAGDHGRVRGRRGVRERPLSGERLSGSVGTST